ncbi:Nop domain-containing protein [Dacryopinax primogenitus]|uniref:Nucleolar protein 56 n=1 Tax=Dacryopinax primogenitus (strain DJM 731) TaxID=1858805 RepID=M5G568_DACPD|nr:Nop domain-containing protein [Dacryopinax primogenitus]EJU03375.1 Nop domain-containing protein [Dacryopinax primogenitus]
MSAPTHLLFESAGGYALFETKMFEEIGMQTKQVQDSIEDLHKFGKLVQLKSFAAFKNAANALENINDVTEGIVNEHLKNLLELNLSKSSKKTPVVLGVSDRTLGSAITTDLNIKTDWSERSLELIRGIRLHAEKLLKDFQEGDLLKAQLGLGHSYSRAKLKFNVNRSDNMIICSIATLDQLDKDVNTFAMRVREWYGWHFPELVKIVPDNFQYARAAKFIGDKSQLKEEAIPELTEILEGDETRAKNVVDAARLSMGTDISPIDLLNISAFADRVISLANYRKALTAYLTEKMNLVAPSLTSLIGERIGARLISHAGSLTNLSKYPASTVQILGAEKALFRALKTKGNTPKYGLIFHSGFIGRAGNKYKGRISRFLANKCSIAARIDCFSDSPTPKFGEALKNQVEERLAFFETGVAPHKNADAMKKVLEDLENEEHDEDDEDMVNAIQVLVVPAVVTADSTEKKKEKRKSDVVDDDAEPPVAKKLKKDKTEDVGKKEKKKEKKAKADVTSTPIKAADPDSSPKKPKKSKEEKEAKKKRKSEAAA